MPSLMSNTTVPPSDSSNQVIPTPAPTPIPETSLTQPIIDTSNNVAVKQSISTTPALKSSNQYNFESKKLDNNSLEPNETARFTIVTDKVDEIIHFGFSILSDAGFVHTSHIESIVDNKVNLVVTNLCEKAFNFAIHYISLHK